VRGHFLRAASPKGGGGWTPADISTALWLDASDASTITLNGSDVSQWNDKSGNSRHASQSTAANQPVYATAAQNGLNAVNPGNEEWLELSSALSVSGSVFVAHKYTSSVVSRRVILGDSPSLTRYYHWHGGYDSSEMFAPNLAAALIGSASLRLNGASIAVSSLSRQTSASIFAAQSLNSGTPYFLSSFGCDGSIVPSERVFIGQYYEIIITPSALSLADTETVEGYLAHKWGTTASLPSGHPYKSSPP